MHIVDPGQFLPQLLRPFARRHQPSRSIGGHRETGPRESPLGRLPGHGEFAHVRSSGGRAIDTVPGHSLADHCSLVPDLALVHMLI